MAQPRSRSSRAAGRRHRRPAERRQEHALQPDRRRAHGDRRGSRPDDPRPAVRRRRVERPPVRRRRHRRARGRHRTTRSRCKVQEQARLAIGEADVIVFVVDAAAGLTPADHEAAELLRTRPAPVLVAVNKADNAEREARGGRVLRARLGGDLPDLRLARPRDAATCSTRSSGRCRPSPTRRSPARRARTRPTSGPARSRPGGWSRSSSASDEDDGEDDEAADEGTARRRTRPRPAGTRRSPPRPRRRAGRDRVRRPAERRQVVAAQLAPRRGAGDRVARSRARPATRSTRALAWGRSEVVLIDTAGHPAARQGRRGPGGRAVLDAARASRRSSRADVAVLVIDAVEGLTAQDAHVAGYVVEEGKGLVVAVNKWDLVEEKTDRTFDQYVEWIRERGAVPRLRAGRLDQREDRPARRPRARARDRHLGRAPASGSRPASSTGVLARRRRAPGPPPMVKGRRPKLFYATQVGRRAADVRVLRARRRARCTSRTGATSRTGCATRSGSTARRSGSCSASGHRCELRRASAGRRRRAAKRRRCPRRRVDGRRPRGADDVAGRGPMTAEARVAVIGAGAWGTTLALLDRAAASP